MSNTIIKSIDAERKRLTTKLRALDKARALLQPEEEVPQIKRSSPRRKPTKRKPSRRGTALNKIDTGLSKTILTMMRQQLELLKPGDIGLKATDIVEVLESRGFMFTSKFPSRSVSGLLTIMYKNGLVTRTPLGKPRIYHYKAVVNGPASVPASSAPEVDSKSRQRRLEHQAGRQGEGDGLEAGS